MEEKAAPRQELQVNIRNMREGDIEEVLSIDRKITGKNRAFTYDFSPLGGELTLSVVAEAEGKIVGFLLGQSSTSSYDATDIAIVQNIGVDPGYLHYHIGTRLMQFFVDCCKKRGLDSIHAMVRSQDDQLIPFLKSMEFIEGKLVEFVKPLKR
ncbi:MAG: GNAT family N-acetyltransferase [Smithellaceae bacterium]